MRPSFLPCRSTGHLHGMPVEVLASSGFAAPVLIVGSSAPRDVDTAPGTAVLTVDEFAAALATGDLILTDGSDRRPVGPLQMPVDTSAARRRADFWRIPKVVELRRRGLLMKGREFLRRTVKPVRPARRV